MSLLRIDYASGELYLPELNLWLDPHQARKGAEMVFVSHAHADHIAAHREVLLTAATGQLMRARLSGQRQEHVLSFGRKQRFQCGGAPFEVTLWPAGHVLGSAMIQVEAGGQKLLYTGDFKLKPGLTAEACQPAAAEVLVMETTYGRPKYLMPPSGAVMEQILDFCRATLQAGETPVLLCYSLGKSQELLQGLLQAELPLMVHEAIHRMNRVYEQFGYRFPHYWRFSPEQARGRVVLCAPQALEALLKRSRCRLRTAIISGWALDESCRFRYECEAAFALTDHADYGELLELVERVKPATVYTLHGFAKDFALTLRERGYDARALGESEQLPLGLPQARSGG